MMHKCAQDRDNVKEEREKEKKSKNIQSADTSYA